MSPFGFWRLHDGPLVERGLRSAPCWPLSDTRLSRRAVLLAGRHHRALSYVGYAFVRDVMWLNHHRLRARRHLVDHLLPAFRLCP